MPGGLTLLEGVAADIPTPAAGKVTIFLDTATGLPSYKDDLGVVRTFTGPTGAAGPLGPVMMLEEHYEGEVGPPGLQGAAGAAGAGSDFSITEVAVSEAEMELLNTTPKTLVAATASKVAMFSVILVKVVITSVYSNNPVMSIRHRGISGNLSGTASPTFTSNGTSRFLLAPVNTLGLSGDPTNVDLVLFLNADLTGAGAGSMTVQVASFKLGSLT